MLGDVIDQDTKPEVKKNDSEEAPGSVRANVRRWQDRIERAKKKWQGDFERMRDNMDFVAGIQYNGQKGITYDKYICNLTLRVVNQGVAMIYAKDPKVVARRRQRLDFQIWDGEMETIIQAAMGAQQFQAMGMPVPPDLMALINDFQQGRLHQKQVEKVGKTLEIVYQYQTDAQQPRFKLQMKQLVRRAHTCGVAYIKVEFCRNYENDYLTQSETRMSVSDRMKMAQEMFEKIQKGDIDNESADVEQYKSLLESLKMAPMDAEVTKVQERLTFDFPRATSIIPDPNTRMLKGFVGARWIVEEVYYPLDFVNAFFETDIKPGGELKLYGRDNKVEDPKPSEGEKQDNQKKRVCLWNVWDLDTKSTFIICRGHKDYVLAPEALTPATKGFWNIVPVTFNDVEVEEGCKATIFPPSVVDLIKPAQKEWNRTRQALRRHRKANGPRYLYPDGIISEEDLDAIAEAEDQQFIKIKGIPPGMKLSDILIPLTVVPVQDPLYNTEPLREDTLLATGQQEANIGPAQPNVTATVGTIAEQSRMSVSASDVDGLDDSLTEVALIGGEMLLKEMSIQTVKHIAGPGAVWPDRNREDFLNEIELEVVAASSGRPNKAVDIANWERLVPALVQTGANPQAIIRETIKRADDRLEPADFYPLPLPAMPAGAPDGGAESSDSVANRSQAQGVDQGVQPLPNLPAGGGVPLAGA